MDFGSAKPAKKKKKKTGDAAPKKTSKLETAAKKGKDEQEEELNSEATSLNNTEGHQSYTYDFMLERIRKMLKDKNP